MKRIVFGTNNPGKLADARRFMQDSGVDVLSLEDLDITLDPEETGTTFEENAWLKYHAYRPLIPDDVILAAEDGGLQIDALDGEPGVHSRRWNGTIMTDQEILDYCLQKMQGITNRQARFVITTVVGGGGVTPTVLTGAMDGVLLESPRMEAFEKGFPFRALFYVPPLHKMLYEIHDLPPARRPSYKTHREQVWQKISQMVSELPS